MGKQGPCYEEHHEKVNEKLRKCMSSQPEFPSSVLTNYTDQGSMGWFAAESGRDEAMVLSWKGEKQFLHVGVCCCPK